jgi:ferritin-like protein
MSGRLRRKKERKMGIAWHAPYEMLKPETRDLARAVHSLMEELEAIDWYGQRVDVTDDADLRRILEHNRDEEKEHAAMVLEWIRRRDPKFDEHLRTYLFSSGDILMLEEQASASDRSQEATTASPPAAGTPGGGEDDARPTLTVGSLRPGKK